MAADVPEVTNQGSQLINQKGELSMALIKCSECGKEISDKTPACNGCGAPIEAAAAKPVGDIDGDGKLGMGDVMAALSKAKDKIAATVDVATEQGKELLKSQAQKDAESVNNMNMGFTGVKLIPKSPSDLNCDRFKAALASTIDLKFAEIMRGKTEADRFLTYVDSQILTGSVRNVFRSGLGIAPPEVEVACSLSEAVLAPSAEERKKLVKAAVGFGGGAAGIGMIIAGVGGALGWGAGVVASVSAFFVGTSMAGPIGWGLAGIALAGVAAYFATTSSKHTDTERFLRVLKSSASRAVEAIWTQHEVALVQVLDSETTA